MAKFSLAELAVSFFLILDSVGSIPIYLALLQGFPAKRRKHIIMREMIVALLVILLFTFLGNGLLKLLHVNSGTVSIAGGIILFIIALQMIFPTREASLKRTEPFIVPLAVPLIAGPAILGTVMIYANSYQNYGTMLTALLLAWAASLAVLLSASTLRKWVGDNVLQAGERLMGFILSLISLNMITNGIIAFFKQ